MSVPHYRRAGYEARAAEKRAKQRAYYALHREHGRAYAKAYNAAHYEQQAANKRRYRAANRERIAAREAAYRARRKAERPQEWFDKDRAWKLRRYGLTLEDYDTLLAQQGGVCAACGRPETVRRKASQANADSLSVDHDHRTNAHRGLLCRRCNRVLGALEDDPALVEALLAYRRRFP